MGSKLAKQGFKRYSPGYKHKFETVFVAVGGVIWLAGSLGVLITRFIKYLTLSGRTFRNDQKTMRLLKIALIPKLYCVFTFTILVRRFIVLILNRLHICVLQIHLARKVG